MYVWGSGDRFQSAQEGTELGLDFVAPFVAFCTGQWGVAITFCLRAWPIVPNDFHSVLVLSSPSLHETQQDLCPHTLVPSCNGLLHFLRVLISQWQFSVPVVPLLSSAGLVRLASQASLLSVPASPPPGCLTWPCICGRPCAGACFLTFPGRSRLQLWYILDTELSGLSCSSVRSWVFSPYSLPIRNPSLWPDGWKVSCPSCRGSMFCFYLIPEAIDLVSVFQWHPVTTYWPLSLRAYPLDLGANLFHEHPIKTPGKELQGNHPYVWCSQGCCAVMLGHTQLLGVN